MSQPPEAVKEMSYNSTTNLDDPSIILSSDVRQTHQKILSLFGDHASSTPPPSKRRTLYSALKEINPLVNDSTMRAIMDNLHEAIWGEGCNTAYLREMYDVQPGQSLRRVLAEQAPLLYSVLKDCERRLIIWVEASAHMGKPTNTAMLIFDAWRVAVATRSQAMIFKRDMHRLLHVEYDEYWHGFEAVAPEETPPAPAKKDDEDHPF
jgi:hypothetical protein